MIFYKRFPGDYSRDTIHLSMVEDGAYMRLMDFYYSTEKPLPLDRKIIYRIARATEKVEQKAVDSVLAEFFVQSDDGYRQKRIDLEIEKSKPRLSANQENGKKGGRPKKEPKQNPSDNPNENPLGLLEEPNGKPTLVNHSHSHKNINSKPLSGKPDEIPPGFAEFWSTWPKSSRKEAKAECLKRWHARGLEAESTSIIAGVVAKKKTKKWLEGYEPAPLTFLNQRQWLDDPADTGAEGGVSRGEDDPEAWRSDPRFKGGK